jgi:hypothetical protein
MAAAEPALLLPCGRVAAASRVSAGLQYAPLRLGSQPCTKGIRQHLLTVKSAEAVMDAMHGDLVL